MNGTIETKKPTTATNSAGFNTNFLKNTGRIMSQKQKKQQARHLEKAQLDDAYFDNLD